MPAALREQIIGTDDPRIVEAELERLGAVSCFFFIVSVGALFGVELSDGTRAALKLHQPHVRDAELRAMQGVQKHLVESAFPCPRPLLEPEPLLNGLATAEEWRVDGAHARPNERSRRNLAALLARQIDLCTNLPTADIRTWIPSDDQLWPRPHNALFDFDATSAGAEWIDEIARAAKARNRRGPRVIGHQDWTFRHVRWKGSEPTVVYDWDSLSYDNESIALGGAAATHTYPAGETTGWAPSLEETVAFLDAYADARPLSPETRRAAEAHAVYTVAYGTRCEHALTSEASTRARTVLSDFAERFL
jgi:Ser/Thr protein kinase RdoA (MazF antagonist)